MLLLHAYTLFSVLENNNLIGNILNIYTYLPVFFDSYRPQAINRHCGSLFCPVYVILTYVGVVNKSFHSIAVYIARPNFWGSN